MHRATLRVLPSTMIAFPSAEGDSAPTRIRLGLRGGEKSENLFARAEASGAIELRRATKLGPNCGERTNINFGGFYIAIQQKAYDPELFATMRGIYFLALELRTGKDYAIFTDSQAVVLANPNGCARTRTSMAREVVGLTSLLYKQGNTLTVKWVAEH